MTGKLLEASLADEANVDPNEGAEDISELQILHGERQKPRLLVDDANPHRTVAALRDILAEAGGLFDRGFPVRLAYDQTQGGTVAQVMTPHLLVLATHSVSRPYVLKANPDGAVIEKNARLPRHLATMYLEWRGEWRLPPLNGITTAPLLRDDGTIACATAYDRASGMWCEHIPDVAGLIPDCPTREEAAAALRLIRETFMTFPFSPLSVGPAWISPLGC
jgi:hypothetical protein